MSKIQHMTIYFNPYYDGATFLNPPKSGLGVTSLGPEGFLRDLELRAGLTRSEIAPMKRVILYRNALRETMEAHPDIFYADSFERDDLGTAAVLLRWRDALVRAGWTKGAGKGRKLGGFSLVEDLFEKQKDAPGTADRWRAMLDTLNSHRVLSANDTVIVSCSEKDTDPFFVKVLDAIKKNGTIVTYATYRELASCPDIYSFADDFEAHKWLARQAFSEDDVIAGADRALLNDMLYAKGDPTVGSSGEEIGSIMSLFSLGLSLFSDDIDAAGLLAYLQVPSHPLNKAYLEKEYDSKPYRVSLRRELEKHLLGTSGMGDRWKEIISSATLSYEGDPLDAKDIGETRLFINMWEKTVNGKVRKSDILAFTVALRKWAAAHCGPQVEDERKAQFLALVDYCNVFAFLLESEPDLIETRKLSLWAGRIVSPMEICGDAALKGSVNLVPNPVGIISAPGNLYWNHSVKRSEAAVPYEYQFLSEEERASVTGADFPPQDLRPRAERNMTLSALASATGKVFIVYGRKVAGEATVQDLVLMEILQKFGLRKEKIARMTVEAGSDSGKVLEAPFGKSFTHAVDPEKVKAYRPEHWSYSAVEELIQHPFDFYVNSILGLEGYGCADLQNIYQVKGNIAHRYVEYLARECGNNIPEMVRLHKSFDSIIGKMIEDNGVMLMQKEYAIEARSFRGVLRKSVSALLSIMQSLSLSIVEVEREFKDFTLQPFGPFLAYIDCLLKDRDGKYVIFDFKWNESSKYSNLLASGDAVQLAFYRRIVEQELGEVAYCGYYVFPAYTFFTTEPLSAEGVECVEEDRPSDGLFEKACEAFQFRFAQLSAGVAEEASGMDISELEYTKAGHRPTLENYKNDKNGGWNGSAALQGGLK